MLEVDAVRTITSIHSVVLLWCIHEGISGASIRPQRHQNIHYGAFWSSGSYYTYAGDQNEELFFRSKFSIFFGFFS